MKLKLAFAMLLGAALGIGANEMLHAQAKPPAYLISDITITNEAAYKESARQDCSDICSSLALSFSSAVDKPLLLGADEPPKRTTLIVFDSLDKAKAWNKSDAVEPARSLPDRGAKIRSWVIEGAQ